MVKLKELSWYPVTRVVDGDTFWIDDGSPKGRKVRLIGADTPETVHPRKEVQTYGREASDYTKKLLTGQIVGLEFDVDLSCNVKPVEKTQGSGARNSLRLIA